VATFVVDVADASSVDALAKATLDRFGAVHVVCNNAGIIRRGVRSWELPLEDWESVIRVNLFGVVHGMLTFVPILLESGEEGHIVNTASMAAVIAPPGIASYTATKHAVLGLSDAINTELQTIGAPIGISVLMPGLVRTRIGSPPSTPDPEGPLDPGQMDPHDVGPHVVRAIKENRLHVFTHPELVDSVRERYSRMTDV
jgi:NAD(P)-dependent dehydrogenase (short-subunit alcohol dehydrogenase family)